MENNKKTKKTFKNWLFNKNHILLATARLVGGRGRKKLQVTNIGKGKSNNISYPTDKKTTDLGNRIILVFNFHVCGPQTCLHLPRSCPFLTCFARRVREAARSVPLPLVFRLASFSAREQR